MEPKRLEWYEHTEAQGTTYSKVNEPLESSRAYRWQNDLSRKQIGYINQRTQEVAECYNYF